MGVINEVLCIRDVDGVYTVKQNGDGSTTNTMRGIDMPCPECGTPIGTWCACWKTFDISSICPCCIHVDLDVNGKVQQDDTAHTAHLVENQRIIDRIAAYTTLKISAAAKIWDDMTVGEKKVVAGLIYPDVTDAELGVS